MLNDTVDGVSKDLTLSPSGDYCSYYGEGDNLTLQISANQGGATGYTTPEPFSSYQEGDANGTTCQANGSRWGQEIRAGVSGYSCPQGSKTPCGMHHYVSFTGQGSNNRPWSGVFGEPSLVVSAEADTAMFTHSGVSYGGWSYVCPEVEDTVSHGVIEYCLEEWRSPNDESSYKGEAFGECNNPFSQLRSLFYPGTQYVTEMAGSANSTESTGTAHYEARITKTNLLNAAKLVNGSCAGWHLSETNAENYALIGVEQGIEGWDGLVELAGSTGNLQLRTEYTPLPPEATTSAASEVEQTQAKLNGTVKPKGTDTHYYFEYGETTSYGFKSEPEGNAGSGQGSVSESTTVTSLEPGVTYHYRIVADSQGGTVPGGDRTVTIPAPMVAFQANTGELFTYSATAGVVNTTEGMWPGTNPSIAGLSAGGYVTAFNANSGELFTDSTANGPFNTKEGLKTGTNPSVAALANGSYVVAFQANTGELFTYSPTTGVVDTTEGMWPGTSPSIAGLATGGYVVAFTANTGELFTYSPTTGVVDTTEGMWTGTSPSIAGLAGSGYVIAFNANTGELFTDSSRTGVANTTEGLKKGTNPSIVGLANGGYVVAFNANTGELFTDSSSAGVVDTTEGMWPGTSPSIAGLPGGGYVMAFNGNTGELFTDSTTSGVVNTREGLKTATNPSITR